MSTVYQFALLGIAAGALYGLAALGLVLVYRGSGVVNFAHGAVGMVGTFCFYELHDVHHHGFAYAAIPSFALSGAIGVAIQLLVMRPLRHASGLSRLLATLGVLTTLQGLVLLRYHAQLFVVSPSLPRSPVTIFGASVGKDRVILFLIVMVLGAALYCIYKFTRFGLATSAVAENPQIAAHLGYSPDLIAGINWAVGSMLAALAGILLAPLIGLSVTGLTLLVIPALAAAVTGKMVSFPVTLAAGLVMGIAQSELARYVSNSGWSSAVPFILILIVLTFRGTGLPTRGVTSIRLPAVGSGRIRPVLVLAALVAAYFVIQSVPSDWLDGINITVVVAIVTLSVVVVTGYAGQVSLAQWVMAGIGAYFAGHLVADQGFPFLAALLLAMLAMIPIGIVVGVPALRSRGDQLAIVTLTLGVAVEQVVFDQSGISGIPVGFPKIFGIPVDDTLHPRSYGVMLVVFFTIAALAVANLRRGRAGRRLLALRSNERAAASLGISVSGGKLYAFALSGMIAAMGGVLYASRNPTELLGVDFPAFNSVSIAGFSVIGGLGHVTGPLVGATLQPGGVGTNVGNLFSTGVQPYLVIIGGVFLILTLIANVDGVVAQSIQNFAAAGRALTTALPAARRLSPARSTSDNGIESLIVRSLSSVMEQEPVSPKTLAVRDLSVRFGGNQALTKVSLDVRPGSVLGLIGPNGAGKTTLIDAVTGYVRPSEGSVELDRTSLTRAAAHQRSRAGIARSYQSLELFDDMTVLENLMVAAQHCRWWNYVLDPFHPGRPNVTPAMIQAIRIFALQDVLHERPTNLPYGQRRLVAIARAVASEPSVLLLDEPAAGLGQAERDELAELIRELADRRGIAVLLIEHDVELVMRLCDEIVALEFGKVIARGTPAEIRTDPAVIAAYLGADEAETDESDRDGDQGGAPRAADARAKASEAAGVTIHGASHATTEVS